MKVNVLPQQNVIKPAYSVTPLDDEVVVTRRLYDKETRKIKTVQVKEPAGFLVTTMRGDSVRIRDIAELAMYGLDQDIPLINEELGISVGAIPSSIKKGD